MSVCSVNFNAQRVAVRLQEVGSDVTCKQCKWLQEHRGSSLTAPSLHALAILTWEWSPLTLDISLRTGWSSVNLGDLFRFWCFLYKSSHCGRTANDRCATWGLSCQQASAKTRFGYSDRKSPTNPSGLSAANRTTAIPFTASCWAWQRVITSIFLFYPDMFLSIIW